MRLEAMVVALVAAGGAEERKTEGEQRERERERDE